MNLKTTTAEDVLNPKLKIFLSCKEKLTFDLTDIHVTHVCIYKPQLSHFCHEI